MHDGDLGPFDLARAKPAAQLAHRFHDAEETSGRTGMGMRQHSPVGVDRKLAADTGLTLGEERAPLAGRAEAELFKLDNGHDREAVVQFCDVDVLRAEARHFVGNAAGFRGAELRQTWRAHQVLVRMKLSDALQVDWLVLELARTF